MRIIIEVTPKQVSQLGEKHQRPVTLIDAQKGLTRAKKNLLPKIEALKKIWTSNALDQARFSPKISVE